MGSNLQGSGVETPIHEWRVQRPPNMHDILTRVPSGRSRIEYHPHAECLGLGWPTMHAGNAYAKFSSSFPS